MLRRLLPSSNETIRFPSAMQAEAKVVSHEPVQAGYRLLRLSCPGLATQASPGQFIHVRVPALDPGALRRPFSLCDVHPEDGTITVLYKQVGRGTAAMAGLRAGDPVDIIGPLGRGFKLPEAGVTPLLVGGGFGVAPLYYLARTIGRPVHLFVGGRTANDILLVDWFERLGFCEVHPATDDGSFGVKGLVTKPLDDWRSDHADTPVALYACGPGPMLHAIDDRAVAWKVPGFISFDRRMACGVGACLGCTQKIRAGGMVAIARVCADGPVFRAGQIVWEEV